MPAFKEKNEKRKYLYLVLTLNLYGMSLSLLFAHFAALAAGLQESDNTDSLLIRELVDSVNGLHAIGKAELISYIFTAVNITAFVVLTWMLYKLNKKFGERQDEMQKKNLKLQLYQYRFEVYHDIMGIIDDIRRLESYPYKGVIGEYLLSPNLLSDNGFSNNTITTVNKNWQKISFYVYRSKHLFGEDTFTIIWGLVCLLLDLDALLRTLPIKICQTENPAETLKLLQEIHFEKKEPDDLPKSVAIIYNGCLSQIRTIKEWIEMSKTEDIFDEYLDIKSLDK